MKDKRLVTARTNAGLSTRQAAAVMGIPYLDLVRIEVGALPLDPRTEALMCEAYVVNAPWLRGDVPFHDYAAVDALQSSDKLTYGDRDVLAVFLAARPHK